MSRHRPTFARLAIVAAVVAASCSRFRSSPQPVEAAPPRRVNDEWSSARSDAMAAALTRDSRRVDSVLRAFASSHAGTTEAAEASYLRGLLLLDPATEAKEANESTRNARNALEAYVAGGPSQTHYVEAVVLRRLAGHLDSLRETAELLATDVARSGGRPNAPPSIVAFRDTLRARGEELNKLRGELEEARAELDRIRKRVAPRRP